MGRIIRALFECLLRGKGLGLPCTVPEGRIWTTGSNIIRPGASALFKKERSILFFLSRRLDWAGSWAFWVCVGQGPLAVESRVETATGVEPRPVFKGAPCQDHRPEWRRRRERGQASGARQRKTGSEQRWPSLSWPSPISGFMEYVQSHSLKESKL